MSKLSHSNPYLDDVYVDGDDDYRFENGDAFVEPKPKPKTIELNKEELAEVLKQSEVAWSQFINTDDIYIEDFDDDDNDYIWHGFSVGGREFDINISSATSITSYATAILYECYKRGGRWNTNCNLDLKLFTRKYKGF